jgi:hypothetical protein
MALIGNFKTTYIGCFGLAFFSKERREMSSDEAAEVFDDLDRAEKGLNAEESDEGRVYSAVLSTVN